MKKLLAMVIALVLCFAATAVAFAADDQVHGGSLPYTSNQDVKITIKGLHIGGEDDDSKLPSEYHVRVKWDVLDGVYNATASDAEDGSFKNFTWDCVTLQYNVNQQGATTVAGRDDNWTTTPKVAFEVTNASTPDLKIKATPSLSGEDAWAGLLNAATIATQNTTVGTQTINPVEIAKMGSGVNSYQENKGAASQNVYAYEYVLNWNYDALNALALANLGTTGTGSTQTLTNHFVVTIAAGGN